MEEGEKREKKKKLLSHESICKSNDALFLDLT